MTDFDSDHFGVAYIPGLSTGLRYCKICGALIWDPDIHDEQHGSKESTDA